MGNEGPHLSAFTAYIYARVRMLLRNRLILFRLMHKHRDNLIRPCSAADSRHQPIYPPSPFCVLPPTSAWGYRVHRWEGRRPGPRSGSGHQWEAPFQRGAINLSGEHCDTLIGRRGSIWAEGRVRGRRANAPRSVYELNTRFLHSFLKI